MISALVTGCSQGGLGDGIVQAFHKKGIHVFATARNLSSLSHLQNVTGITCLQLDVTSPDSISEAVIAVTTLEKDNVRLKYLVNNAGRGLVGPLLDGSCVLDDERAVFETNVWGPLAMIRAFVPLMVESGGGTLVNIGSSAGVVNVPWNGIYAASKTAMNMLSETIRLELEPLDIKTITVVAGIVKSNFFANLPTSHSSATAASEIHQSTPKFKLAEASYYKSLEPEISKAAAGDISSGKNIMTAQAFGEELVSDVLRGRKGKTYSGTLGWGARWIPMFPVSWLVCYLDLEWNTCADSFCRMRIAERGVLWRNLSAWSELA
ncbi:NAD(P)-binding protein [Cadophora sp. DSE1049]|nr:NAD(P)-binding protein [Cadophora sp. DSE1049]